jgi:RNA polymerase sigma factor (sigma-70 family)
MEHVRVADIRHDPAAFEAFYRANVEAVQRFVARRVADPHLAADLTAEVFLAAIDAAPSFKPGLGSPRAWLFGVARNVVNAEWRRAARENAARQRVGGRRHLGDDDIERIQERLDAEADARALAQSLAALPESERAVLELVAVDQLTVTEAAAALGIRSVTARVRLHRGRTTLRAQLPSTTTPLTLEATP